MKRSLACSGLVIAFAITFACKKKKHSAETPTNPTPTPVTYDNYSQLKVGNYWVYEEVQVGGQMTLPVHNDSCYISKDTIIRNQTYYKYHNSASTYLYNPNYYFIRDSLHYTIDSHGKILFSSQDFTTVFNSSVIFTTIEKTDTMVTLLDKMADKDFSVTTKAGTFVTSDFRETVNFYPVYGTVATTTFRHKRCAKNIGVIIESNQLYAYIPDCVVERRLLRYHLN